ncbi:hypothetical protein B0H12DRAFT_544893 [Mycena haematopus]|nr:hypothetical protein B0H12DRAFT_544893 [Mycena haematopus]
MGEEAGAKEETEGRRAGRARRQHVKKVNGRWGEGGERASEDGVDGVGGDVTKGGAGRRRGGGKRRRRHNAQRRVQTKSEGHERARHLKDPENSFLSARRSHRPIPVTSLLHVSIPHRIPAHRQEPPEHREPEEQRPQASSSVHSPHSAASLQCALGRRMSAGLLVGVGVGLLVAVSAGVVVDVGAVSVGDTGLRLAVGADLLDAVRGGVLVAVGAVNDADLPVAMCRSASIREGGRGEGAAAPGAFAAARATPISASACTYAWACWRRLVSMRMVVAFVDVPCTAIKHKDLDKPCKRKATNQASHRKAELEPLSPCLCPHTRTHTTPATCP